VWLITGAAGYLGTSVCDKLDQSSIEYVGLDSALPESKNHKILHLDLADLLQVRSLLDQYDFTGLIHLAALKDVKESSLFPEKYWYQNVTLFSQLLGEIGGRAITKVIYASSASVYGMKNGTIVESEKSNPISVYGKTKLEGEKLLNEFTKEKHISSFSLRIFNMAGVAGNEKSSTGVMKYIKESQNFKSPFVMNGVERKTHDGSAVRDFISVNDVANTILTLANNKYEKKHHVVNVGRGEGVSLKELVETFEKLGGSSIGVINSTKGEYDIDISIAGIDKLRDLIGEVKFRTIEQIVKEELFIVES
jgi:UDP-glucose 4-epimerase